MLHHTEQGSALDAQLTTQRRTCHMTYILEKLDYSLGETTAQPPLSQFKGNN